MGVDKLWSILEPSSNPIRIETLQGARLAIDASIWLHQFQKAMRDSEGESVKGAHLVGFLRRICKLLFHGIRPVFVYDGGVPELKKKTISKRKALREKSKETVSKTAQSLLENQLKLQVLTGETLINSKRSNSEEDDYLLPSQKRAKPAAADVRMPSEMELYDFITDHKHEIDLDNVNINSDGFKALSLEKQHEIILNLKNASRTPNQARVQEMLANSKSARDFSTAQIKNLVHRAALTNRYHSTLKDGDAPAFARRVTGYRSKEFVLTKNHDSKKGGWELKAQENIQNVVADLSGLQGFKQTPTEIDLTNDALNEPQLTAKPNPIIVDLTNDGDLLEKSHDYVFADDKVSAEDLWSQIQSYEKLSDKTETELSQHTSNLEVTAKSLLEKYLVPMKEDLVVKEDAHSLNESVSIPAHISNDDDNSSTDFEDVKVNTLHTPEKMEVFYSNFEELRSHAHNSSEAERKNMLAKAEKRLGKSSREEEAKCHQFFIHTLQSISSQTPGQSSLAVISRPQQDLDLVSITPKQVTDLKDTSHLPTKNIKFPGGSPKNNKSEVIVISDEEEDWEPVQIFSPEKKIVQTSNLHSPPKKGLIEDDISPISGESFDTFASLESVENIGVTEIEQEEAHEYLKDLDDQVDSTRQIIIDLAERHRKGLRDMSEISTEMVAETQELLKLFGIPYITSPMEAESQCAYLLMNDLVDGIVTDDSDVFLFGGSTVYRNMFNSKKYIECFTTDSIKESLGLERFHFIQLAYLLGSDYAVGIKGLGPVKSVEIVTEWESEDLSGLKEFQKWVLDLKDGNISDSDTKTKKRLRNACKKLVFPANFPEEAVFNAYFDPRVEESLEEFKWGEVNMEDIITFLQKKLSWDSQKSKSLLIPVIKEMHTKKSRQTSLDSFFHATPRQHKSARIQEAVKRSK